MLTHLRSQHKLMMETKERTATPARPVHPAFATFTASSSSTRTSSRPPPTQEQKRRWTSELLRMVVEMNVSFRTITESTVLRQFMLREAGWNMPRRDTLRRLIPTYYHHLASNLKAQLKGVDSISITTDSTFLTSHQVPYICITGHWIDSSWRLHHTVLAVFVADQGESGDFIAGRMKEVLEVDLGLTDKVHCVVTDERQNFLKAVSILRDLEVLKESLRCACHRIQLSVKKAMAHAECKELLALLNKCQALTLQFKNGWMSRKRDILRICTCRSCETTWLGSARRLRSTAHATRSRRWT